VNDVETAKIFVDLDFCQRHKAGQTACGDRFVTRRLPGGDGVVMALSDGLGSGVKANILSTMTAVMAVKFAESGMEFPRAADTMMRALPVCSVRKISYATFTIAIWSRSGLLKIVEAGNPGFIFIRDGKEMELDSKMFSSDEWSGRTIRLSEVAPADGDRLFLMSDGISQAGIGTEGHPLGWRRDDRVDFILKALEAKPSASSRELAGMVMDQALSIERGRMPHDDMTCASLHFRSPKSLLVAAGPPFNPGRDSEWAKQVAAFKGEKAVCGGSTSKILARELKRDLRVELERYNGELPPSGRMEGFSLVTEGILTLTRAAQILEGREFARPDDPAARLAALMRDNDSICFMVGTKVNEAHQDPSLPTEIELRRAVVKRIDAALKERYLKETSIKYV